MRVAVLTLTRDRVDYTRHCFAMLTLRAYEAGWKFAKLNVGLHHLVSGTAKDDPGRIHQAAQANRARWVQAVTDSKLVTT